MSKYNIQPGDRVKIAGGMPNEPDPLPIGTMGTVVRVLESSGQIDVDWDNGRSLFLLADVDPFWVEVHAATDNHLSPDKELN
ncbi:DUF4314 domain-containing protein [Mycolicibacter arupensis]|jgi:hypothetical protein|uniref:DUF4314 domain-containing protein n=1 Tax=Mycolicibacter arupensis TaxID=342002 RepID=A0A5C7XW18_9MYCO|nr:DUF4314 domain-containing protein [Mycolicibacter arupensis]TXI53739.1 MAG: DUF4314 domain-containing protein [Mycolicibacter arupensis]